MEEILDILKSFFLCFPLIVREYAVNFFWLKTLQLSTL